MADHCRTGVKMSHKGKILVAHPNLKGNEFFEKSVIYLYEHDTTGASGLILNKVTPYAVTSLVEQKGMEYIGSDLIHKGGPLSPRAISILHTDDWYNSNTITINAFGLSSDNFMLEKLSMGNEARNWRMFSGMCGWAPGQLEAEINGTVPYGKDKGWLIVDATEDLMFNYDGDDQWVKAVDMCSKSVIQQYF